MIIMEITERNIKQYNSIIERMYFGALIMMIPVLYGNVIRVLELGLSLISMTAVAVFISLAVVLAARKRVNINIKVAVLSMSFIISAVMAFLSFGLYSMAAVMLMSGCVTVTLFMKRKWHYLVFGGCLSIVCFFYYMYSSRLMTADFDIESYYYSPVGWINRIIGFALFTIIIITAVNRVRVTMSDAMQEAIESEAKLKNLSDNLELVVEERSQALNSTMNELVEKERLASLGSLVAGVSHEINTPLGVAVSAVTFIEEENSKAFKRMSSGQFTKEDLISYMSTVDDSISIISKNVIRAAELVKNFKQISVDQSNEVMTEIPIGAYIDTVLATLKHEYKNLGHTFEVNCPNDLIVVGYKGAFAQVITNLVMNALVHGFGDKVQGIIKITGLRIDDQVKITFEDNGRGIDKNSLEKIFDPFYTTNRAGGGTGLGLNIVYNLVTGKLGGSIQCISEPGKGTRFDMYFPEKGKES